MGSDQGWAEGDQAWDQAHGWGQAQGWDQAVFGVFLLCFVAVSGVGPGCFWGASPGKSSVRFVCKFCQKMGPNRLVSDG